MGFSKMVLYIIKSFFMMKLFINALLPAEQLMGVLTFQLGMPFHPVKRNDETLPPK